MMDSLERTQYRTTSNSSSELFVCFNSRLSSSSMKLSSKSILSPGRTRDPPVSLSNSRSRRLRTNGSIKGGQASPMFPKKRGSAAFENPEPSSPKVTCIGQVRVKTKKQQEKKMRTLSRRRAGEVSFRNTEQQTHEGMNPSHDSKPYYDEATNANNNNNNNDQCDQECLSQRNQRWVCEALRAFGADHFSCLFPCFSTSQRGRETKGKGRNGGESTSSCGTVFARWLVALQDGEGGNGREIELVVGGEELERTELKERTLRRHVFEEMEIRDEKCEMKEEEEEEEEEGRVSICIPPKNALLLMRCRSDPMRVSALANRIWESPLPQDDDEEEEDGDEEGHANVDEGEFVMVDKEDEVCEMWVSNEAYEEEQAAETKVVTEIQEAEEEEEEENPNEKVDVNEELQEEIQEKEEEEEEEVRLELNQILGDEGNVSYSSFTEALVHQEAVKREKEANLIQEEEERGASDSSAVLPVQSDSDDEAKPEFEASAEALEEETEEKETHERLLEEDEERVSHERSKPEEDTPENHEQEEDTEPAGHDEKEERESSMLPDCLVLMMCEPKLSMEVSKETWVCNTDFIRWLPQKLANPNNGVDQPKKTGSNPTNQQPPRSSCSLPAPPSAVASMAAMIEQKLLNAVAYEPLVLTRCKSAPMRTAANLAPHAYFWKGRKIEPYRRATFGVGAAGVGF